MNIFFFDTETTGFPRKDIPMHHEDQPHLVELAFIMLDQQEGGDLVEVDQYETLVHCPVPISEDATAVHGITREKTLAEGVSLKEALERFISVMARADACAAHNAKFDQKILQISAARYMMVHGWKYLNDLAGPKAPLYCTMLTAVPICKPKWPKLSEAYEILVDPAGFKGAHRALEDVKALVAVYAKLAEMGVKMVEV